MRFPAQLLGRFICDVSVRSYDAHPEGTLVRKEINYSYHKSESFATRLTFLAHEGEHIWIELEVGDNGEEGEDPCLMICRLINGSVHLTPLALTLYNGSGWTFNLADTRTLTLQCKVNEGRITMCYREVFDSRHDDRVKIRLTWDIECLLQSPGEVAPDNFVPVEGVDAAAKPLPPVPLDKRGKRVQCCTTCKRPRRGHIGFLGLRCTMPAQ